MSDSKTFSIFTYLLLLPASHSFHVAGISEREYSKEISTTTHYCWKKEGFSILSEYAQCNPFQMKLWTPCDQTGFIEKINCAKSNTVEYKNCHSFWMEESLFWRFEWVMMGLMVAFVLVVVTRQRILDHLASEKVRRSNPYSRG
ncbi:protein JTB-like [Esox lucius]|uniref:protein JTB-like n=1 Tax=Esox lucius TaxID=8010 RepID=UPI001476DC96|nr:protein JTB-like [Esox lucius]